MPKTDISSYHAVDRELKRLKDEDAVIRLVSFAQMGVNENMLLPRGRF